MLRPGGFVSGPIQFALADTALWFMTFTVLGLAPMAVTSEMSIQFLRPAVGGDVIARAEMLRAGRHKITGTVRLWVDGAPERPVAHVVGSYMRLGWAPAWGRTSTCRCRSTRRMWSTRRRSVRR